MPYTLRCSLCAHSSDVRALTTMGSCIISGSRDQHVLLWTERENLYELTTRVTCHAGFVASLCVLPPGELFPEGLIFSGGHDLKVFGYKPYSKEPSVTLTGHTGPVCCLITSKTRKEQIISSSWDGTAKSWDILSGQCVVTFSGHNQTVWCALHAPEDFLVTGSADKLIKIYSNGGTCLMSLEGHTDCVRGLTYAGPEVILSCGNDGTVRKWNILSGVCLDIIFSQNNYIYSIAASDSLIVFGGEGNSLTILPLVGDTKKQQAIQVPATSVWAVSILPNSDIVIGTSDGYIRIFTRDPSRAAAKDKQVNFVAEINSFLKTAVTKELTDLPYKDSLKLDGTFEGELKFISDGGARYCYKWSQISSSWKFMGDASLQWTTGASQSLCSELDPRFYYPPERYVLFEQYDSELIMSKIKELMCQMNFPEKEMNEKYNGFVELISNNNVPENNIQIDVKFLIYAIRDWPEGNVFPVLDIGRISILKKVVQSVIFNEENNNFFFNSLHRFINPDALAMNKMFSFRILSNIFSAEKGEIEVYTQKEFLVKIIPDIVTEKHSRLEVAIATFLLNLSLLAFKKSDQSTAKLCADCISKMLTEFGESEAIFRLLVALGTLGLVDRVGVATKDVLNVLKDISNWEKYDNSSVKASTCASCILRDFSD